MLAGHLNGALYEGAGFREFVYLINVDKAEHAATAGRGVPLTMPDNPALFPVYE